MENQQRKVGSASKADVLWVIGAIVVAAIGYARYFELGKFLKH